MSYPVCEKCKLFRGTSNPCINSVIPPNGAKIAFVAEAPGEMEEAKGLPLVGPAGKNFDLALTSNGIRREDVFVGNCVRCRPLGNRTPTKKEVAYCFPNLLDELRSVRPLVIVCLGLVATKALLRSETCKMTEVHGRPFLGTEILGYPCAIIPTWHPSPRTFALAPDRFSQMIADIGTAYKLATKGKLNAETVSDRLTYVVTTYDDWEKVKDEVKAADVLAFDLETTGLDFLAPDAGITNIGIAWSENKGLSILLTEVQWEKEALRKILLDVRELLSTKKVVCHNFPFDAKYTRSILGYWIQDWHWDTALVHTILYPGESARLKEISHRYTSMGGYEYDIVSRGGVQNTNSYERAKYNADDCICTMRIYQKQRELIGNGILLDLVKNIVMPSARILSDMEYVGIKVDENQLRYLSNLYSSKIVELKNLLYSNPIVMEFNRTIGLFNPQSHVQTSQLLFDHRFCAYQPVKYTAKGKPSCNRVVLQTLANQGSEICRLLLEYHRYSKLFNTYMVGLSKKLRNGRAHTHFHQGVAISGRTSCSDPALHQIPKESEIRSIFVPDPGYVFLDADYKQMELVVSTFFTKDPMMIEAIMSGDAHTHIAKLVFGFTSDQVTEEKRRFIKTLNFGVLYGMGSGKLADTLGISPDESEKLIKEYFKLLPKTKEWIDSIRKQAERTGYVSSLFGRVRRYLTQTSEHNSMDANEKLIDYNSAVNHPIQSTASDLMLLGLKRWWDFINAKGLYGQHAYVVLQVHDEILSCVRPSMLLELAKIKKKLLESLRFPFMTMPLSVEIKAGYDWGSCKEIQL
jgi:DNA polymerase-1